MEIKKRITIEIEISDTNPNHCSPDCKFLHIEDSSQRAIALRQCMLFQVINLDLKEISREERIPIRTEKCKKKFPNT